MRNPYVSHSECVLMIPWLWWVDGGLRLGAGGNLASHTWLGDPEHRTIILTGGNPRGGQPGSRVGHCSAAM